MKKFFFLFAIFSITIVNAQQSKKNLVTKRVSNPPKIDGNLDDEAWKNVDVAKDFVMFRPASGTPEPKEKRTEVKVVYDDEAIYFGAYLYDDKPDEIPSEFANRDNFGAADFFGVVINPNNDSQNDTEFFVQITGNQMDAKSSPNNEDFSWSAVWDSQVTIVDDGWIVEIKIPYSALRFSNDEVQTWGLNFHRHFRTNRDQYSWNFIDRTVGNIGQYSGTLTGIRNITPPTRLSFSPYASSAYNSFDGENEFDSNIGLDVKYGISESFTLDATLIPDFGQTAFDNLVLNLGPFEQQYQEQRPFFTEGTELFSKANLFYSRRVGNSPIDMYNFDVADDEEIIDNPGNVKMLNAIKVSGRTKGGLGVGVFNAVTEKTEARIKNLTTDEIRKVVTEPLANYNVLVLDQQFNQNSFVSFVNTNVLRNGHARDANASALMYYLGNKKNTHNVNGGFKMSHIREDGERTNGYWFDTSIGKSAGNWQWAVGYEMADKNFDINDLGFQRRNDYQNVYSFLSYRIYEPTEKLQRYGINTWFNINYRHSDGAYTGHHMGINYNATTLKQLSFGGNINGNFGGQHDYFEPRATDRFYTRSPALNFNGWLSTDYNKKFAFDINGFYGLRPDEDKTVGNFGISPRYRFSAKFNIVYRLNYGFRKSDNGWVNELDDGSIIFGNRDSKTVTNSISGKYNFSVKSGLSLTFRHYWSPVEYNGEFSQLNNDGTLTPHSYTGEHDVNFNTWNFDLSYAWQFAPGSQLIALYRNSIFNVDDQSSLGFKDNLSNLFDQPRQDNISLKLIYFIDYNNAKNWFKKNS